MANAFYARARVPTTAGAFFSVCREAAIGGSGACGAHWGSMLSYAITAEDGPALEHLLISVLPTGIAGLESQPWINHHGEVRVVLEADGDAGKIGVGAEFDFLDCPTAYLWELHQPGAPRFGLRWGGGGAFVAFSLLIASSMVEPRFRDIPL